MVSNTIYSSLEHFFYSTYLFLFWDLMVFTFNQVPLITSVESVGDILVHLNSISSSAEVYQLRGILNKPHLQVIVYTKQQPEILTNRKFAYCLMSSMIYVCIFILLFPFFFFMTRLC